MAEQETTTASSGATFTAIPRSPGYYSYPVPSCFSRLRFLVLWSPRSYATARAHNISRRYLSHRSISRAYHTHSHTRPSISEGAQR